MNAKSFDKPVDALNLWQPDQYELLDFGLGRKLERFGSLILDRPCPAATAARMSDSSKWSSANIQLADNAAPTQWADRQRQLIDDWRASFGAVQFQLRITPFGHVGLFPEHAAQWKWLVDGSEKLPTQPPSLLNLFAYTGGASLFLASLGWQVTHVDAAEPTVQWARHNAVISCLAQASIRWLVEDARAYVTRELKRGRRYDAILLDPPGYGHGPKGNAWQIDRDLLPLLEQCCRLLLPGGAMVLTGHSDPIPLAADEMRQMLEVNGHRNFDVECARVTLRDSSQRALDFGWCLRAK